MKSLFFLKVGLRFCQYYCKKSNNTAKISWRTDHTAWAIAPVYKNVTPDWGCMVIRNFSLSIFKLAE